MKISYSGCAEPIVKAANWRKRQKDRNFFFFLNYTSGKCIKSPHSQLSLEATAWRMQGWTQPPPALSTAASDRGQGVPCPFSKDLKACGVCGGHLLRSHFCSWLLEVAQVTWCHLGGVPVCVLAAGKAI